MCQNLFENLCIKQSSIYDDLFKNYLRDLPGSPVLKSLLWTARDASLIPDWEAKILHALGQLSPGAATTDPVCRN